MPIINCQSVHLPVIEHWLDSESETGWHIDDITKALANKQYVVRVLVGSNNSNENKLLGFYLANAVLDECSLLYIFVDANCRQQGSGATLLADLLDTASSRSMRSVLLEVRRSNTAAIALYRSSGFEQCGVRKKYYPSSVKGEDREDALLFSLAING